MGSENPPGMSFGYARVSTADQDEALQRDALEAAGCDRLNRGCTNSERLDERPSLFFPGIGSRAR